MFKGPGKTARFIPIDLISLKAIQPCTRLKVKLEELLSCPLPQRVGVFISIEATDDDFLRDAHY